MENVITTEKTNKNTINIDILPTIEILKLINNEDLTVAEKISENLDKIALATDIISENFIKGGRLLYFGAGTSGRLGVLDASECPPTFNTPSNMVQGIIAGGDTALRNAIEGAEDSVELAQNDFSKLNVTSVDTVVAISASGNAPYCIKILELSKQNKTKTIAVTSNPSAKMSKFADVTICIETGAETITGSTRMKAGTAQKMVLNMLSTSSMVKIGKTYKNFMVDVKPTNSKLKNRAIRIVAQIADTDEFTAQKTLTENSFNVKEAILQIKYSLSFSKAKELLVKHNGILRKAFEELNSK